MISVRSSRALIQEIYYPDEWKCLVCCLLLNRTKGTQVRGVLVELFDTFPYARNMAQADLVMLTMMLRPLGFQNRRARLLVEFSNAYDEPWKDVTELPGVGEYASDFWRIFFLEELGDDPPKDHALTDYWRLAKAGMWPSNGWEFDPLVDSRRWLRTR